VGGHGLGAWENPPARNSPVSDANLQDKEGPCGEIAGEGEIAAEDTPQARRGKLCGELAGERAVKSQESGVSLDS
tara:strand:+ start:489125 stop:489349 length:225 start_codon:yes stop_codon:yes gene_type:complete